MWVEAQALRGADIVLSMAVHAICAQGVMVPVGGPVCSRCQDVVQLQRLGLVLALEPILHSGCCSQLRRCRPSAESRASGVACQACSRKSQLWGLEVSALSALRLAPAPAGLYTNCVNAHMQTAAVSRLTPLAPSAAKHALQCDTGFHARALSLQQHS